ncbi:ATP-dependent helicase, partial [Bacillus cereus]|nr:ATP-dependent helicase [Bacillus cereus]
RLGQKIDVHIYNLATKHTVEEHILKLLYEKINLFERVIGELDEILTRINMKNIDAHIQEIFAQSKSEGEIRIKMENLTSIIDFAKRNEAEVQGYAAT